MTDPRIQERLAILDEELASLPVCAWAQAQIEGKDLTALFSDPQARREHLLARDAHVPSCPTCQRRGAVMDQMERTVDPGIWRQVGKISEWVWRRPLWLQPALTGAGFFGAYSLIRIAGAAMFGRVALMVALEGLVFSTSIGGAVGLVGGNAYRFFKPRGERWGPLGPYLAGIGFAAALGLATALVLLAIPETSPAFRRPFGWLLTGAFVLVGGLGAGGAWFRKGTKFEVA